MNKAEAIKEEVKIRFFGPIGEGYANCVQVYINKPLPTNSEYKNVKVIYLGIGCEEPGLILEGILTEQNFKYTRKKLPDGSFRAEKKGSNDGMTYETTGISSGVVYERKNDNPKEGNGKIEEIVFNKDFISPNYDIKFDEKQWQKIWEHIKKNRGQREEVGTIDEKIEKDRYKIIKTREYELRNISINTKKKSPIIIKICEYEMKNISGDEEKGPTKIIRAYESKEEQLESKIEKPKISKIEEQEPEIEKSSIQDGSSTRKIKRGGGTFTKIIKIRYSKKKLRKETTPNNAPSKYMSSPHNS
ncbi:hypothetical protein KY366_07500 [Candidatus Woesearchaeota archaeon]|nr:hypothetical protein [Candidatus Woesearchaeota archaeon]